jgi:hypothetical protein
LYFHLFWRFAQRYKVGDVFAFALEETAQQFHANAKMWWSKTPQRAFQHRAFQRKAAHARLVFCEPRAVVPMKLANWLFELLRKQLPSANPFVKRRLHLYQSY